MGPQNPYNILLICSGNICRSPMAEGILKAILPAALRGWVGVDSAGIRACDGLSPEPFAVRACKELGVDIASHRAKSLTPAMLARHDLLLVMERHHASHIRQWVPSGPNKVHLLGGFNSRRVTEEVADPYGGSLEVYQQCAARIRWHLDGVVKYLSRNKDGMFEGAS